MDDLRGNERVSHQQIWSCLPKPSRGQHFIPGARRFEFGVEYHVVASLGPPTDAWGTRGYLPVFLYHVRDAFYQPPFDQPVLARHAKIPQVSVSNDFFVSIQPNSDVSEISIWRSINRFNSN